jgi:hypothetical protein
LNDWLCEHRSENNNQSNKGENMKVAFAIVGGLVAVIGLTWIIQGNDFLLYKFWAPKQEAVRREVFEQTKSYRQGMVQDIRNYRIQYQTATKEQKDSLRSVILQETADFPINQLPADQREWLESLRNQ